APFLAAPARQERHRRDGRVRQLPLGRWVERGCRDSASASARSGPGHVGQRGRRHLDASARARRRPSRIRCERYPAPYDAVPRNGPPYLACYTPHLGPARPRQNMPRRDDIHKILILGSGPIVIGQAAEFDYSGTQACKALRSAGFEVVLVNSNPATIMTDPEVADRTYIEPLTPEFVERVIEAERPDALLPTLGGQTALNLASALHEAGILERHGVKLIGANYEAIQKGEDRQLFQQAMADIGIKTPAGKMVKTVEDGLDFVKTMGYPAIIRPSFTLGGTGCGIANDEAEFRAIVGQGLHDSPVTSVLVEQSVLGWIEYELEVMRDTNDTVVIICSIENFDPMGVHTGDSITVAPAQTLSDKEYQRLRNYSIAIIREIGVETGGSNIQFAVNPEDGDVIVIEMNPRVSRSS